MTISPRNWRHAASRPPTSGSSSAPASTRGTFAAPDVTSSDLGLEAARHALEAAGRKASDIDLIIVATSTPDMVFPSSATILQHKLGIAGCPAFDVQAVCSGFVYALTWPTP
jgi:3-oxoacyl-[acyl-carrier-protein] synthase III